MRSNRRVGLGLSAITLLIGVLAGSSALAAGPPAGIAVTVTNTPLPVTLTNAATQYPRTPVVFCLGTFNCPGQASSYQVPLGQRLVIETISYTITTCDPESFDAVTIVAGTVPLTVAASRANGEASIVNLRVVVEPDQLVFRESGNGVGRCDPLTSRLWLSGYLVSVNSPSLAP
jgi:hypothetical protein